MKKRLATFSAAWVMTMLVFSVCHSSMASLTPDWAGQSESIYHLYTYPDDSTTPAPAGSDNPYGHPLSTISLGTYASGWQDPEATDPPEAYGDPAHGAWSLGDNATDQDYIEVTMPINEDWVGNGLVYLHVNVVGYTTLSGLPDLAVDGIKIAGYDESYAFDDYRGGNFSGDEWWYRTWTPQLSGITDTAITFRISGDEEQGSVIDTVEIYAIPEPSSIWIMTLVGAGLFVVRRFWSRIRSNGS